ncbi:hypothetical protein [Paraferrimonas haliotis]|uniref:DUF3800 domain-containing protein n=1 Tax=Paraferrimonas haliotis TaxID=2013866 RepID=A0AA37TL74_9GAMM|nr:hypothetical protein [Paraferrimonas haliotis]GLS83512.1 hypothetical protein GCM10007894_14890 [Paraferrimonas haliotis]
MKYTLFIDESGDFESNRGQWLISGFLCNADYETSSKALDRACNSLPSTLGVKSIRDFHLTEFRKDFGHKEALNKAQTFIETLTKVPFDYHFLSTINESKVKITNREKTYRVMLFDLLSLFESALPEGQVIEQLDIVVATRTIDGVRQTKVSDIEDDVIRKLPQALEVDLATKGLVDIIGSKIKIHLDYANNLWGLVAADFLANINYHNKRQFEAQILNDLTRKGLFTGFKTFSRYQERRAFVAERDQDYALASVRWLLMLETEGTDAAISGLNRTLTALFTKLGVAGARTAFEAVLDRLWRLCKPGWEYERFIKLLSTLKDAVDEVSSSEVNNLEVFAYRTNVFLLKIINHIGNTQLALQLLEEQKILVDRVIYNPDNLSLIMDGLLVESEVFYNDLDFDQAFVRAKKSYELAENYSSLSAIILESEENCDSSNSIIFLKAKMNYLRHAIRKEEGAESLSNLLSALLELYPFLPASDFSRFRILKAQLLLKMQSYDEAISVTLALFDEPNHAYNNFDKLAYLKAVNGSLITGAPVAEQVKSIVEGFANEHEQKAVHPIELLYRELAIFYYLNDNLKLANKFIRKSANAISANNAKISDYLHEENSFLQDLIKGKLDYKKGYLSSFPLALNKRSDKRELIQILASYSPL